MKILIQVDVDDELIEESAARLRYFLNVGIQTKKVNGFIMEIR